MRMLYFMLKKEFLQIFRNKMMLPILFVMPIIQLLILANAATFELKSIPIHIVDQDRTQLSRHIISSMSASDFFEVHEIGTSTSNAINAMDRNKVKAIVVLPAGMEKDLMLLGSSNVQVMIDAVDGYAAGISQQYITRLLTELDISSVKPIVDITPSNMGKGGLRITWSHWYNPTLDYIPFMVPGILVVLVSMIGGFLSGMNVVREREIGTMEQLNVTPITRWVFIAGKLLPFWIIALLELIFGLTVAAVVFNLLSQGSILLILGSAGVFMVVVLGLGLFVSTISDTQQQAMFITWFIMVLFILMGGLFTPIDSMPLWAQQLTLVNPMAWYIDLMRRVMLTGAGLEHVWKSIVVLGGMGIVVLGAAIMRFRKFA